MFAVETVVYCFSFSVNLYKVTGQFPWSSVRETDKGISTEISVSAFFGFVFFLTSVI